MRKTCRYRRVSNYPNCKAIPLVSQPRWAAPSTSILAREAPRNARPLRRQEYARAQALPRPASASRRSASRVSIRHLLMAVHARIATRSCCSPIVARTHREGSGRARARVLAPVGNVSSPRVGRGLPLREQLDPLTRRHHATTGASGRPGGRNSRRGRRREMASAMISQESFDMRSRSSAADRRVTAPLTPSTRAACSRRRPRKRTTGSA